MPSIRQREERVREAVALSAVGGFLDAYTFLTHGGVFANAQTGNVVLFGLEAGYGHWHAALRHVPPVLAFVAGIVTVEALARSRRRRWLSRPARLVLGVECVVFAVVGLTPMPEVLATVLIAWAATLQVGTFRQVRSSNYNTTFTTGNIRTLVSEAAARLADGNRAAGARAAALLAVVSAFAAGAVLGTLAVRWLHDHAVLLTVPVLLLVIGSLAAGTARLANPQQPDAPDGGRPDTAGGAPSTP